MLKQSMSQQMLSKLEAFNASLKKQEFSSEYNQNQNANTFSQLCHF